jgi:hypothetical protein
MELTTLQREPEIREKILGIEKAMRKLPNILIGDSPEYLAVCPLKHSFVDGAYVREIFLPKGMLFVTKIHKKTHPYFIMKGDVSVLTEEGVKRIKGPLQGITKAGTKRVIYTHEDTVWITVHVTNETDLAKIEDEVIAKTFDEIDKSIDIIGEDISEEKLLDFMAQVSKKEEEC